jgi:hypothetical protein
MTNGQDASFCIRLDITHTYRIKLVIADGGNNVDNDSAIFLELVLILDKMY